MNTSLILKNAILNLYKAKVYTVDFAIIKATDYASKNLIKAVDYEDLLAYLVAEQEKEVETVEEVAEENVEETIESEEE